MQKQCLKIFSSAFPLTKSKRITKSLLSLVSKSSLGNPVNLTPPLSTISSKLTQEQYEILKFATSQSRPSLFFTGSAGTGKTFLLNKIISELDDVSSTAMTGIAALRINGMTLHSWAGISDFSDLNSMLKQVFTNRAALRRWKETKTLVIDECSMLSAEMLDLLNAMGKTIRRHRKNELFGGIQVILSGDFCQLPPVNGKFCFEANVWKRIVDGIKVEREVKSENNENVVMTNTGRFSRAFELNTIFRQKDPVFIDVLNYMRGYDDSSVLPVIDALFHHLSIPFADRVHDPIFNQLSKKSISLKELSRYLVNGFFEYSAEEIEKYRNVACEELKMLANDTVKAVPLFPLRRDSEKYNMKAFNGLNTFPIYSYEAVYTEKEVIAQNTEEPECERNLFSDKLLLRRGVQVMLLRNLDASIGLVNGSIGVVEDFVNVAEEPLLVSRMKVRPADNETGIYLPRVKFPIKSLNVDELSSRSKHYDFLKPVYKDGSLSIVLFPMEEKSKDDDRVRIQLPLQQAWSYSIHKSQGQTLNKIIIDIHDVFESGMFYVALSRGVSLCGIQIVGYDEFCKNETGVESVRDKIWRLMKHDRVKKFYDEFRRYKNEEVKLLRKAKG